MIINHIRLATDGWQFVFGTLTIDGDECKAIMPTPILSGADLDQYVVQKKEWLVLKILKDMYPGAEYQEFPGDTELERFEAWITAGHMNGEEAIEKVPFKNSHDYTGTMRDRVLEQINTEVNAYICSNYDMGTQASFQALYVMDGTPIEVKTALLGVWAWVQSILGYYYTKKAEIAAAGDPESVAWDFPQFDATDPQVSLQSLVVA